MGEENSYTLVVEWCYREANFGRRVIPVLYENYWEALDACHKICEMELSHFEQINGKGDIKIMSQDTVPFEPFYEMWHIYNVDDAIDCPCSYIVRPVIVPAFLQAVPNIENNPLSSYAPYYTPKNED